AGVDVALVGRYFGSKEELFGAVLKSCESGQSLMDGPRETFGERMARQVIHEPKGEPGLRGLLIMLRSVGSARASELVRQSADARFFRPFIDWLGGPDAEVRTRLAAGLIMGMAIS